MPNKEKHDRFQRVAQERKGHVLECLQALGNCSDPASYTYEAEELPPIFREIAAKLAEVWHRMSCHSPYPFVPFSLGQKAELEIGGHRCRWQALVPMTEVLDRLHENGATFSALEPVRERYTGQFGNELCWSYPHSFKGHLGCVILPVREGVLCLPYDALDSETFEQLDAEAIRLLNPEDAQAMMDGLLTQAAELYGVLADVRRALPVPMQDTGPGGGE